MSLATIQQQQQIAGQSTDWSSSLTFNQFDPSFGLLQDINVGLVGTISGWIALENLDAGAAAFMVSLPGTVSVAGPDGTTLASVAPDPASTVTLGAYDGTANFAGSSGSVLNGLTASASAQTTLQAGTVGVAGFVGTGTVALPVTATASLHATGPANMDVLSHASAGATVTLNYDYSTPSSNNTNNNDASTASSSWLVASFPIGIGPAGLTTTVQTFSFADRTTGWNASLAANPFDPSLGRLVGVNLTLSNDILASVNAENLGSDAGYLTTTQTATATLNLPGPTQTLSTNASVSDGMILGAYYAGPSGHIDQGLTQTGNAALTLTNPSDLAAFLGQGSVVLPVGVSDSATLDGPANLSAQLLAQGGATVTLSYTYLPTPVISGAGNALTYAAGQAATTIAPTLTLADAYATTLTGAQVTITGGAAAGDLLEAATTGTGISAAFDPTSETLTLSGSASVATYQQVLRSVAFASTSADPSKGGTDTSRTVQWSVTDTTGASSAPATSSIVIPALPAQWSSPVSGDWSNGADWTSGPITPNAAQDVAITQAGTYTIDVSSAQVVHSLVLDAPGAVLQLDAPLTVLADFTMLAGSLVFNSGSLGAGAVTLDGGIVSGNTIAIVSASTIAVNGGTLLGGTINFSTSNALTLAGGTVIGSTLGSLISTAPLGSIVATGSVGSPGIAAGTPIPAGIVLMTGATWVDTATSGDSPGILDSGSASVVQRLPSSPVPAMQFLSVGGVQSGLGLSGTGAAVTNAGSSGADGSGGGGIGPSWMLNEQTGGISAIPFPVLSGPSLQPNGLSPIGAAGQNNGAGAIWFPPPPHAGLPPGSAFG